MDDRKKTIGMIVLCCLLFLFAGVRFWSMAADSRQQAELNSRNSPIQQRIVSKYGPPKMEKDPFGELDLTAEQRRKIDDIMNSSMPKKLPAPGPNHVVRMTLPMDKIRAILTPEQQRKFDQMHSESGKPGDTSGGPMVTGSAANPPPGGPGGLVFMRGRQERAP